MELGCYFSKERTDLILEVVKQWVRKGLEGQGGQDTRGQDTIGPEDRGDRGDKRGSEDMIREDQRGRIRGQTVPTYDIVHYAGDIGPGEHFPCQRKLHLNSDMGWSDYCLVLTIVLS